MWTCDFFFCTDFVLHTPGYVDLHTQKQHATCRSSVVLSTSSSKLRYKSYDTASIERIMLFVIYVTLC